MSDQLVDLIKHLWEPIYFMLFSGVYGVITVFNLVTRFQFGPFSSFSSFKEIWFATFWRTFGPMVKETALPNVEPLIKQARGVVLDIGPGAGDWLHLFDQKRVTKIYGVEPNRDQHPLLRENIKKAGLSDIYEILAVGVEDLESQGIALGSVDTVVTIHSAYAASPVTLFPLFLPLGLAAKSFIFTPATSISSPKKDTFNPGTATLGETFWHNVWGWDARTKTVIARTTALMLVSGGSTFLQSFVTLDGVESQGAVTYSSVWVWRL